MKSAPPLIQVFILTYNRPAYFQIALNSILNQNFEDYSVVVSDNSTDDDTEQLIQRNHYPRLHYIRRKPSLPPLEHFNAVLSEVTSDYFMIFHDDDIMEPDCLKLLSKKLKNNPDAAAAGGNASCFWNEMVVSTGNFLSKKNGDRVLSSPGELASIYLLFDEVAPFPSYMYRRKMVNGLTLSPNEGGKYADMSFLMKVLGKGKIIWEGQIVMRYRKHTTQDSQKTDMKNAASLLQYIIQNTDIRKKSYEVRYFRYKSWAGVLKSDFLNPDSRLSKKRLRKIYCAIMKFSTFDIFLKLVVWQFLFYIKRGK